jgi:hypothetical protein
MRSLLGPRGFKTRRIDGHLEFELQIYKKEKIPEKVTQTELVDVKDKKKHKKKKK